MHDPGVALLILLSLLPVLAGSSDHDITPITGSPGGHSEGCWTSPEETDWPGFALLPEADLRWPYWDRAVPAVPMALRVPISQPRDHRQGLSGASGQGKIDSGSKKARYFQLQAYLSQPEGWQQCLGLSTWGAEAEGLL